MRTGKKGELIYRGFWAAELAQHNTYEDVLYLLLHEHLPGTLESVQFHSQLAARRTLPVGITRLIEALPRDISHMTALRSVISALHVDDGDWPPVLDQALSIFAKEPTIVAYRYRLLNGKAAQPDLHTPEEGSVRRSQGELRELHSWSR